MLLLEKSDGITPYRRKSIIIWSLTVAGLEDSLGRLIDGGGGDGVNKHAVLSQDVPESRRDVLVRHDRLSHSIDVTNALFRRSIGMMFTLWHNDMLDAISKEEVVKLVAADLTAEVRVQSLGVTADACDKLDIRLLSTRLFAMRDKKLGTSLAADKQAVVAITTA